MALADRPAAAQFASDQRLLEALQGQPQSDDGIVLCCRLVLQYENTGIGSQELARAAQDQLEAWGLDRRKAFALARRLWFSGWRPTVIIGSQATPAAHRPAP